MVDVWTDAAADNTFSVSLTGSGGGCTFSAGLWLNVKCWCVPGVVFGVFVWLLSSALCF